MAQETNTSLATTHVHAQETPRYGANGNFRLLHEHVSRAHVPAVQTHVPRQEPAGEAMGPLQLLVTESPQASSSPTLVFSNVEKEEEALPVQAQTFCLSESLGSMNFLVRIPSSARTHHSRPLLPEANAVCGPSIGILQSFFP